MFEECGIRQLQRLDAVSQHYDQEKVFANVFSNSIVDNGSSHHKLSHMNCEPKSETGNFMKSMRDKRRESQSSYKTNSTVKNVGAGIALKCDLYQLAEQGQDCIVFERGRTNQSFSKQHNLFRKHWCSKLVRSEMIIVNLTINSVRDKGVLYHARYTYRNKAACGRDHEMRQAPVSATDVHSHLNERVDVYIPRLSLLLPCFTISFCSSRDQQNFLHGTFDSLPYPRPSVGSSQTFHTV